MHILITSGSDETSEIIEVVKPRTNSNISIITKRRSAKGLPTRDGHVYSYSDLVRSHDVLFGGCIGNEHFVANTGENLFSYKMKEDKWEHISITRGGLDGNVVGCGFRDMLFVVFSNGSISPHASLIRSNTANMGKKVLEVPKSIQKYLQGGAIFIEKNNICHQIFCATPIPFNLYDCSVSSAGENKVMVIGGTISGEAKSFIGELNKNERDFKWKEVKSSMKMTRVAPVIFQLDNDVYVAGGEGYSADPSSQSHCIKVCTKLNYCERYDLKDNCWHLMDPKYNLPYPLSHASVVVSEDETFAVITGGLKGNTGNKFEWTKIGTPSDEIIVFTKDSGFKVFHNFTLNKKRWGHVSMMLNNKPQEN